MCLYIQMNPAQLKLSATKYDQYLLNCRRRNAASYAKHREARKAASRRYYSENTEAIKFRTAQRRQSLRRQAPAAEEEEKAAAEAAKADGS